MIQCYKTDDPVIVYYVIMTGWLHIIPYLETYVTQNTLEQKNLGIYKCALRLIQTEVCVHVDEHLLSFILYLF